MSERSTSAPADYAFKGIPSFGSVWIDQRGSEVLERGECLRLLALAARRGNIGRLGIPTDTSPIVIPVNFSYLDADVLVRVGEGSIADHLPGQLVAFEVDNVDSREAVAWSVLVRGLATSLTGHDLHRFWQHLPEPQAPQPGDLLFSIRSDVLSGRRFSIHVGAGGRGPEVSSATDS